MPESVSNRAGICAAILVRSPVILFIPAASPSPVDTIVILSTLASGAARARTAADEPIDDRGLVPLLVCLGLQLAKPCQGAWQVRAEGWPRPPTVDSPCPAGTTGP